MNSRELAINVLYKVEFGEGYSNVELDKEFQDHVIARQAYTV